ncbi:salicylate hydroxylase [Diaporthe helianthi]|uniref:Salicylate hydroxylase n=1 Tax=Diaporthe helianthi TaxID=158607 RepID=A0A2P5IF30_DIAHE|nr:salicylate hydroxylase [Diaporthe helianthi]
MASTANALRVLVAGGGIGGLTAAVALRQRGHDVDVFEKSRLHRGQVGAAVYLAPNCTAALSHIDVHAKDYKGTNYRGFKFVNTDCEVEQSWTYTEEQRAKWPAGWWLVNRPDLHEALKEKATSADGPGVPVRIHTGTGVESVDCEAGTILLSDGTRVGGDLIVCADGIHSKTRASVVGTKVPMMVSGHACYRWLTPVSVLQDAPVTRTLVENPGHFVQITGSDRRIVLYPCSEGRLVNCVAFVPRDEVGEIKKDVTGYDQRANKRQLIDHFKSWSEPVLRLLDTAPDDGVMLWDLLDMELLPKLVRGKAHLIGDAAHPFLPHMGQGAAQAVEDACALGAILPLGTTPDEIPSRLGLWQQCRRDRAAKIVMQTRHRSRKADGSQGPPQTIDEFNAAMAYCIHHDAWTHAEQQLKEWSEAKALATAAS